MKTVHNDLFEALKDAFEFSIGPVQIFMGGLSFDIETLDVPLSIGSLDQADLLLSGKLRDGRTLKFKLSSVDGFTDGNA